MYYFMKVMKVLVMDMLILEIMVNKLFAWQFHCSSRCKYRGYCHNIQMKTCIFFMFYNIFLEFY